jgi:hypothetical protein
MIDNTRNRRWQCGYSYLKATIGSTPMARRAGSSDAVMATSDSNKAMPQ